MKIAFIYSKEKFSGKLTKFWTGSYCYHVAFVDEKTGRMYDQNLLFRKRRWPYYNHEDVVLIDPPVDVSADYLEYLLETDEQVYGFMDYILFALRPVYHFFGKSTRNFGGIICSERIYQILKRYGWKEEFKEVPSPADLERALLNGAG